MIKEQLRRQRIETPSWAYGNSGTRFKVFAQRGVPRDPYEKIADAAQVHAFTGVAPTVALHIPWDKVDDYEDRKSTRLNSSHVKISYAVFCLKKKRNQTAATAGTQSTRLRTTCE